MIKKAWTITIAAPAAAGSVFLPVPAFAQTYICTGTCPQVQGSSSAEPRYGGANSLQFQSASVGLDMFDIQPEGPDRFLPEGDSDTIGGAFTYGKAGFQKIERLDLHYQHARRFREGSRARLVFDLPVNILHADKGTVIVRNPPTPDISFGFGGATNVAATASLGVEIPVSSNFVITPRVSYGNSQAGGYFLFDAEVLGASVSTRYRLPKVGRGELIFGGLVGYSHEIKTFLSKQILPANDHFWTLRGGVAYQLPLKTRLFGRQASVRASYVYTRETGVPFAMFEQVHEVGFNIGVRTREVAMKSRFEQLRFGVIYTHAVNAFTSKASYDAATLTFGYRF